MMRILSIFLLAISLVTSSSAEITLEEARRNGMQETLRNYIGQNSIIADICVFEQTWIPASPKFPKGRLIRRAVVTNVHCGPIRIGDRIEYMNFIEEPPKLFNSFTSTVPGELLTFFYSPGNSQKVEDGWLKIGGDDHWGFSRINHVFADLFALELKTHPKLKPTTNKVIEATR
ncbi:MAG: hypothetical protein QM627_05985 [Luteolibacter sp.]